MTEIAEKEDSVAPEDEAVKEFRGLAEAITRGLNGSPCHCCIASHWEELSQQLGILAEVPGVPAEVSRQLSAMADIAESFENDRRYRGLDVWCEECVQANGVGRE